MTITEKRRHPRYPMGISVDIQATGQPSARLRGTIADFSAGGMAFRSDAELEQGMCLLLKLDIPLDIRGEIRSIKGASGGMNRYGIRFHKVGYQETRA